MLLMIAKAANCVYLKRRNSGNKTANIATKE